MRRCIPLLLFVAVVGLPSAAHGDAQTINFRCIFQYCHERFYALAEETFYDPTKADWTVEGGVGILDANEMEILQLILANPAAPHHDAVHAAFAQNQGLARTAIGNTIIGLTTSSATSGPTERQTITASPTTSEFIIRNPSGTIFALADLSTGDFKLKGSVYEEVSSLSPPDHCFVVKGSDEVVAFVTTTNWTNAVLEPNSPHTVPAGSLILSGHVVLVDVE